MSETILRLLGPLCALLLAPLLIGFITRVKAFFAGRQGQPILQPYYDLVKLFGKGAVYSTSTTWVFKLNPAIGMAVTLLAVSMLPLGSVPPLIHFPGDLIVFVGLFGVMRFLMISAAMDTGSAFEGMGASREAFFAMLAEPVLLVGFAALVRGSGQFSLATIIGAWPQGNLIAALLIGAGFFVVLLAENCRIPVDDPTTHLELTMIHEVMVLDSSGPDLGAILYAAAIKLWIFSSLVVQVLIPFRTLNLAPWQGTGLTLCAIFACAAVIGIVESAMARLQLLKVPQLLISAFALVVIGFILATRGLP